MLANYGYIYNNDSDQGEKMRSSRTRSSFITIPMCVFIVLMAPASAMSVTVTIAPATQYQIFEGWGTSLCWWAETAGKWNEANRKGLIGAIVDPDTGLGYTCFRYNIGGGDNPAHTHLSGARAVPGFKATETGQYDWTADQYQRNILLGIAARGNNMIFEAFSNSPPWWMTISECASGNASGADNLKSAYFGAFADYLSEVVKHYKDTWGITFRTVEPFNEPSSGYWKENGGQEGCGFKSQQSKMIKELGKQLAAKGLSPASMVSASDETALDQAVASIKSYDDSALSYLSQFNSHSYGGWNYRKTIDSLAKARKKNLWQSESGPLGKDNDASDITMWMSHVIIQDLRVMKANAWIDWQVCDPVDNWRTIEVDDAKQSFKYNKRYYMHAAFSRFIRPGSQIIASSDTNSVAALVAGSGNLVVVLRNDASTAKDYTIDLSKCTVSSASARLYLCSLPGSLTQLSDVSIVDKKLTFSSPKLSITTVVIPSGSTSVEQSSKSMKTSANPFVDVGRGVIRFSLPSRSGYLLDIYDNSGRSVMRIHGHPNSLSETIDLKRRLSANGVYVLTLRQHGFAASRRMAITR